MKRLGVQIYPTNGFFPLDPVPSTYSASLGAEEPPDCSQTVGVDMHVFGV